MIVCPKSAELCRFDRISGSDKIFHSQPTSPVSVRKKAGVRSGERRFYGSEVADDMIGQKPRTNSADHDNDNNKSYDDRIAP